MKYERVCRGPRLEGIGAHGGWRVRLSTLAAQHLDGWPVTVHVRGSESEDEVTVPVPARHHASAEAALAHGWDCAVLWIDALEHRRR